MREGGRVASEAVDALSAESEKVLVIAKQEALGLRHEFTGTEHILLGLLACDDDIAAPLLAKHGIVAVEVRAQVARPGSGAEGGPENAQPLTARAKQVLTLAGNEAEALEDDEIRPEHLLLGIIRQASGVAALVLRDMGVDLAELREEVHEARESAEGFLGEGGMRAEVSPSELGGGGGDRTTAPVAVAASEDGRRQADARPVPAVTPPLCPSCGERLTDVLATATVASEASSTSSRRRGLSSVTLIYCGACGHTLAATR